MDQKQRQVFVLGAGFTKAFLPHAPLLVDSYDINPVIRKYKEVQRIADILERERDRLPDGNVDIERLLTRLEGMPFDSEATSIHFESVRREIHESFLKRLKNAKESGFTHEDELRNFAYYCLVNRATCLTFNYDDVLDQKLHEVSKSITPAPAIYWHPNSGYGFYIPPSAQCIGEPFWPNNSQSATVIHKLHGSTNWRMKLGFGRPHCFDGVI